MMIIKKNPYLGNFDFKHLRSDSWCFPVMEIPEVLNPFHGDGVDMFAALAYHLPYENIKFLTVLGLLIGAKESGMFDGVTELVEATSGNTGVVLAQLATAYPFNIPRVTLITAPDIPAGKRSPLILAGANIRPPDGDLSAISTARRLGGGGWWPRGEWRANGGCLNLDQYANPSGYKLHEEWTGPKISAPLLGTDGILCLGIGTGGTLVGISNYFRANKSLKHITIVGVLCSPGEEIPGVRDRAKMKEISLPWEKALDHCVETGKGPSYLAAVWFHRFMGITPGPTSGFVFAGGIKSIKAQKDAGLLKRSRSQKRMRVVFLFPDGSRPYGDRFEANVPFTDPKLFSPPLPWHMLW